MTSSSPRSLSAPTKPASSSPAAIPSPFTPAPSSLLPFLDTLDTTKVYITHIDAHPAIFKRRIFAVPVLLNLTIFLLLLWRAYAILPTYYSIALSVLGHTTPATVDVDRKTWGQLLWIIVKRSAMFMLDFLLVRLIWPWPLSFFVERPANPVSWRWAVGFRDKEVYVRLSRGWGAEDLLGSGEGGSGRGGEESPFFKVRILPAIERKYMRKTGYLMMDASWDLDFAAMVRATRLVDEGVIELEQLEKMVLVWVPSGKGEEKGDGTWAVWEVHRLDEGAEEEGRKKIVEFKDRLTAMGKESLFFRWIELIQYESSQPGGFTQERQAKAVEQARQLFQEQGVDFDEFIESVGGVDAMPGLGPSG